MLIIKKSYAKDLGIAFLAKAMELMKLQANPPPERHGEMMFNDFLDDLGGELSTEDWYTLAKEAMEKGYHNELYYIFVANRGMLEPAHYNSLAECAVNKGSAALFRMLDKHGRSQISIWAELKKVAKRLNITELIELVDSSYALWKKAQPA